MYQDTFINWHLNKCVLMCIAVKIGERYSSARARHSGHVVCDIELENCTDSIKTVVQETARMASLPAGAARNIIGIFMENVFTAGGCITARHQH